MTEPEAVTHSWLTSLGVGFRSVRRHPVLSVSLLVATVTQGALQGLLVWVLREVLRLFGSDVAASFVALGALSIFGIWFLRALSTYAGEVLSVRLARRVEIGLMQTALAKLLTLPMRFFERTSQGDLVMVLYTDIKGARTVTMGLGTIVLSASRLVGLAVAAWLISPKLALVGLLGAPLGMIPAYWLGQRLTRAAYSERDSMMDLHDSFLQVSSGIRAIKVNRGESRVLDRAKRVCRQLYDDVVAQAKYKSFARLLFEVVSGLGLIIVLIMGGRDVAAGLLDWQSLLAVLIAVMAVFSPTVTLLGVYGSIRQVMPNLNRVETILHTRSLRDAPSARPLLKVPETIELQDVSFAFSESAVLHSVSAKFHRGETIGIAGPSGSGKSTLVALMMRLYDPTCGRILFGGVDLREIQHASLLDSCAIVLQEPFLFIDTIANNIRIGRPTASMEEVVNATKAANVHEEIVSMVDGYDTVVGQTSDGRGVSVGQKQRICIAAALLKNAPLLFLDEATSSLDSVAERAVQAAINQLMADRTTFVIAHRLSTLRTADRILVLNQGRVVGFAAHDKLLGTCPTYKRLWQQQMIAEQLEGDRKSSSDVDSASRDGHTANRSDRASEGKCGPPSTADIVDPL